MAKLIINPSSPSRREIPLGRTVLSIGRDPTNDLVLPDAMVSRRHALVEYRGSQYFLRDCNSSNGSLINGDRVSERNLRDGDLLAIGTARLLFRDDYEEEPGSKVVQHPSAPRLSCPNCQADYRKGDLFCRQCGTPVAPNPTPKVVCTSCGTVVPLPAKFCNACGSTLIREDERMELTKPRPIPEEVRSAIVNGGAGEVASPIAPDPVELPDELEVEDIEDRPLPRVGQARAPDELPSPPEAVALPTRPMPAVAPAATAPPRMPPPRPAAPALAGPAARSAPAPAPARIVRPAGFGPRVLAALIDGVVVTLAQALVMVPAFAYWWTRPPAAEAEAPSYLAILMTVLLGVVALVAGIGYYLYYWGVVGATPGKAALGLRVQGADGRDPIGVPQAAVRLVAWVVSGALGGVGHLMAAFGGGLALHDRIAETRVVKKERG